MVSLGFENRLSIDGCGIRARDFTFTVHSVPVGRENFLVC